MAVDDSRQIFLNWNPFQRVLIMKLAGLTLLIIASAVYAAEPTWFSQAAKGKYFLRDATPVAVGHYTGAGMQLMIDRTLTDSKPERLEWALPSGCVLEDVILHAGDNTTINLVNCTLRRVGLKSSLRGVINLQNCALEDCYVTSEKTTSRRADGGFHTRAEVYAEIGTPLINLSDCVVARSMVESPYMTGLIARNCTFLACQAEASEADGKLDTSRFLDCVFKNCKFLRVDFLLATRQCRFDECECLDVLSATAGGYLPQPVLVRLIWENGNPVLPTATKNEKIHFEAITARLVAGSTVQHGWDGTQLTLTAPPAATSAALQTIDTNWQVAAYAAAMAKVPAGGEPPRAPGNAPDNTGMQASPGNAFKSQLAQVNGLLIMQLPSGKTAGGATKMSLTALPSLGQSASMLKFNQNVGGDMLKALNEVTKFSQLRHKGWPSGHAMEIGFEEKYVAKDGPSAAVACALLLEAVLTGKKWDPAFAVTGDMNADGSVQPIGGVQAKIRGATKGACSIAGVPAKNEKDVADLLVLEGPEPLVGITVFGLSTFADALLLADPERPRALQNALSDFDSMRKVMLRDPKQLVLLLKTPQAAQRLQALYVAAPNCYSAKYLLLYIQGRAPRTLSLGGSIEAAQSNAQALVNAVNNGLQNNGLQNIAALKGDELGDNVFYLRKFRPNLDSRVWPYVDRMVDFGVIVRELINNPPKTPANYNALVQKAIKAEAAVNAAHQKLMSDPQVVEELGL